MECYEFLQELNLVSMVVRILLVACCGGILGIERAKSNQTAGMRTYMLVCVGAKVVMLTSQYMAQYFNTGDPARLGAQVISGIGFLGAGSIMTGGKLEVRGLTTAAGLWTAACIGLAVGIGFYAGGAFWAPPRSTSPSPGSSRWPTASPGTTTASGCMLRSSGYLPIVYKMIEEYDGYLSDKEVSECREDGSCGAVLSIKLPREKMPEEIMELLSLEPFVKDVKFINYNI